MGIEINADLDGIKRLASEMEAIRGRVRDLEPALLPRAELLRTVIDDSFRDETGPNGEVWDGFAESTINRRRQASPKLLVDTGQLRRSIEARAEKGAIVFGVAGAAATYAPAHQFGTEDIPARPFLPMDEDGNSMFSSGRAREWAERTSEQVMKYLFDE